LILAIDQSIANSGIALLRHSGTCLVTNIQTNPTQWDMDRYNFIANHIRQMLDEHKCDAIVMEDYAHGATYNAMQSGEVGMNIRKIAYDLDLPVIRVPIQTCKMVTTGTGAAKKDLMLKSVYKNYGCDVDDDNQADAVALLCTFIKLIQWDNGADVIKKVDSSFTKMKKNLRPEALEIMDDLHKRNIEIPSDFDIEKPYEMEKKK